MLLCFLFPTFSIYQLMAEEKKLQVDFEGFNRAMKAARERSKTAPKKVFVYFSVPFRCQNSL